MVMQESLRKRLVGWLRTKAELSRQESGEARPERTVRGSGLMPIPYLCTLECVITVYYKLMNIIITRASMFSPSAGV